MRVCHMWMDVTMHSRFLVSSHSHWSPQLTRTQHLQSTAHCSFCRRRHSVLGGHACHSCTKACVKLRHGHSVMQAVGLQVDAAAAFCPRSAHACHARLPYYY